MSRINRIQSMLETCSDENRLFPPTTLYNEGWMLRLVIDWFAQNDHVKNPLSFLDNAQWYSEALLTSAFLARYKGDKLSETYTHADGVIGNIRIGVNGAGDLGLLPDARRLVVLEAKMFSKLSSGVTHAKYYNQAARNVACIAETLKRGARKPEELSYIGFYVIAPQSQIDQGVFKKYLTHASIQETVERRVSEYNGSKDDWFHNWFLPTINQIDIQAISWESLIEFIKGVDSLSAHELSEFYNMCLHFNQPKAKK